MDYIGRYENLAESFETISSRLGVQTELPVLREGSGADYRGAYTSQMIDVVSKVYKRDIKMLRYSFGER